jgi:hypothetical protein
MTIVGSQGREAIRLPALPTATKWKINRNWNRRYQDGKHKPMDKK